MLVLATVVVLFVTSIGAAGIAEAIDREHTSK